MSHDLRRGWPHVLSADRVDGFLQAASYINRILRGTKPVDLPVQTPTKYELVIDLTTR